MNSDELLKVSSAADIIVCGYAFSKTEGSNVRVLDLKKPHHALLMSTNGEVLETTMDDVELSIVKGYWEKNKKYMEESHASNKKLTEAGSAKFFVRGNGDTEVRARGILRDKEIRVIREFIKDNYKEMYILWAKMSPNGFYGE